MKCSNCGAELLIDSDKEIRYCPYCGKQVELIRKQPPLLVSIIQEIGKQTKSRRKYETKREREAIKQAAWIFAISLATIIAIIGLCLFMAYR